MGSLQDRRDAFGRLLSDAVQKHGIHLHDLSNQTRIREDFLDALIVGNFDYLPGEIFGLGFVKSICKVLGENEEEFVRLYKDGWEKEENFSVNKENYPSHIRQSKSILLADKGTYNKGKLAVVAGLLLAGAVVALVYIFFPTSSEQIGDQLADGQVTQVETGTLQPEDEAYIEDDTLLTEDKSDVETKDSAEQNDAVVSGEDKEPDQLITSENGGGAALPEVEAPAPAPAVLNDVSENHSASFSEASTLKMVVKNPVRVKMRAGQDAYEIKEYAPDIYTFPVDSSIDFLVYDASAVDLFYAGKSLGYIGGKDRIRRFRFTKKSM